MRLPSADEYIQIISGDKEELPTLRNYNFYFEESKKTPFHKKSRRVIVFKAEHNSKAYAIRFFLIDDPEFFKRYQQAQDYFEQKSFSWQVPFNFSGEGYNPMVKMDWIESLSFREYLDLVIDDPSRIASLQSRLVGLHRELEGNGIAHSNLNLKHIRFVKQGQDYLLKLIDYDSIFLPFFEGKDSFTTGMPGFQHPMRLASDFSETIDRFSFWVFLTALEAFKTNPSLWQNPLQNGFNKEEHILFTYRDLASPSQSEIFQLLKQHHNNALTFYTEKLLEFCKSASLESIEAPKLYDEKDFRSNKIESIYAPKQLIKTETDKKKDTQPATVISKKTPVFKESSPVHTIEQKQRNDNGMTHQEPTKIQESISIPAKTKRRKPIATIIIIAFILVSFASYFVWASYLKKSNNYTAVDDHKGMSNQRLPEINKISQEKAFFTSANISQFLFGLYQSYNKRSLSSILGNYADSLIQYYDAGTVTKNQLNGIIHDLFIKPAYYECNPDLTTLQFNTKGNICKVTVTIHETIKTNARSKIENYSSKIEYLIDSAFKIQSEKNIE